jgi:asparagine synthase (glutamine-hydrolysing)
MCGIAEIFDPQMNEAELDHQVATMAEVLRHRGPDDGGTWVDGSAGIAFGHGGVLMFQQWLDRFRTMEES